MSKVTGSVATTDKYTGAAAQSTLVYDKLASTLISDETHANYVKTQHVSEAVSGGISDTAQALTNGTVVSLSAAWIGISAFKPASTEDTEKLGEKVAPTNTAILGKTFTTNGGQVIDNHLLANENKNLFEKSATPTAQRYERQYLYSLKLGEYFMPLSQTFNLRAKKRLNVCSLVDGVDIIQQTRHEAKTIDCSLRLTLRTNQPNLEIVSNAQRLTSDPYVEAVKPDGDTTELVRSLQTFSLFLSELYEKDAVFAIDNKVINDVFGVEYAMISEYNFRPQVGRGTFQFDFTLTEVKITNDTLTFDKTQIK